jgi:hypothetical protein
MTMATQQSGQTLPLSVSKGLPSRAQDSSGAALVLNFMVRQPLNSYVGLRLYQREQIWQGKSFRNDLKDPL